MILLVAFSSWYPALLLSGFSPHSVFRSEQQGGGGQRLRKGLVVFQFAVAVILIIATITAYRQLTYMRTASLGFDKNQVVVIKNLEKISSGIQKKNPQNAAKQMKSHLHSLKTRLQNVPGVKDASLTFSVPSQLFISEVWHGVGANRNKKNQVHYSFVDANYLQTLGISLTSGRSFSDQRNDSLSVILNKAAAQVFFGSDQKALGDQIYWQGNTLDVIGIVKDFHYNSLRHQLNPMALIYNNGNRRVRELAVKLQGGKIQQAVANMKQIWSNIIPSVPFNYSFLDRQVAAQYKSEQQTGRVFAGFTILAVIVACLGLFGLTTYATQRRTKEIGIRKVLGASVANIVGLLSKDFLKLVAIGFMIAIPIGWYAMHRWLQSYAYKTNLSLWLFLLAGAFAFFIALATVSWQSIRAALANPVNSLRSE